MVAVIRNKGVPLLAGVAATMLFGCGPSDPATATVTNDFRAHRAEYQTLVEAIREQPYIQSIDVMSDGTLLIEPRSVSISPERRRRIGNLAKARSIYGLSAGPWGERPTNVTIRFGSARFGGDGRVTILEFDQAGFQQAEDEAYRSEDGLWRVVRR